MNIRLRLTLWYTVILSLILLLFSLVIYFGLERSLIATIDNHLQREAAAVMNNLRFELRHSSDDDDDEEEADHDKQRGQLELNYQPEEGVLWRVTDAHGKSLLDHSNFDKFTFESRAITSRRPEFEYAQLADKTPIRLYTVPFIIKEQGETIIQVAEDYAYIQQVQNQLFFLLALTIPLTLAIASIGGWFLASNALAPIDQITLAAQAISANDLHQRLNLKLPNDEVGRLATTFDTMLARLDESFNRQKRFIADASHEMRTPLTILKGDVEVALMRPRSVADYQETLVMVDQTVDRLTALVEELLLLARAENNQVPLQLEQINLSELLAEVISSLELAAQRKQIKVISQLPPEVELMADYGKLSRLFINLLENALKYSSARSQVTIQATLEHGQAKVEVSDNGQGIAPEHLVHLFERFYRVDKARSRQTTPDESSSGSGLGLSIAEWIVTVHGGRITVQSEVGHGTTFTVWLPQTIKNE